MELVNVIEVESKRNQTDRDYNSRHQLQAQNNNEIMIIPSASANYLKKSNNMVRNSLG